MSGAADRRPGRFPRAVFVISLAMLLAASPLALVAGVDADGSQGVPVAGHQWGLTGAAPWAATDQQAEAGLIRDLGVTRFRPTIRWSAVQPDGPDEWDWSDLDALFSAYRMSGARAWVLLTPGQADWATQTECLGPESTPSTGCPPRILPGLDEPITCTEPYYVFIRELVVRYGDAVSEWLIDNEPSESWSWAGDGYAYACTARLAAAAVHDADPQATAVLGAIPVSTLTLMVIADRLDDPSQEDFVVSFASRMWGRPVAIGLIQAVFANPDFEAWDRVNFFRQALAVLPETDALAGNVLGVQTRGHLAGDVVWAYEDQMLTHGGLVRPMLYTEVNTYLSDPVALARETTQFMIGSLASGAVEGQAYHQFIDGSLDLPEPNSGLVTASLQPKPAYYAYRTLIARLGSAALAGPLEMPAPLHGYWFESEYGETVCAVWADEAGYADLSSLIPTATATVTDMVGRTSQRDPGRVAVSAYPAYVTAYHAIALEAGAVAPSSGTPMAPFTWRVEYRHDDNTPPDSVTLVIASAGGGSTSVPMSPEDPADTDYADGARYVYSGCLPVGDYQYQVTAAAAGEEAVWPARGEFAPGPSVPLTGIDLGQVTPDAGASTTTFGWRLWYWHGDNAAPDSIWLGVSNGSQPIWQRMSETDAGDEDFTDGKCYGYAHALSIGGYYYRFAARVAGTWHYWPQPAGSYRSGPTVAEPALSSGGVEPAWGAAGDTFTWSVTYWSAANTPADRVWIALSQSGGAGPTWHAMSRADAGDADAADGVSYTYSAPLEAGHWYYRFAAQAGGGWVYWPSPAGSYQAGPQVAPPPDPTAPVRPRKDGLPPLG